jgi:hypothetical protein
VVVAYRRGWMGDVGDVAAGVLVCDVVVLWMDGASGDAAPWQPVTWQLVCMWSSCIDCQGCRTMRGYHIYVVL